MYCTNCGNKLGLLCSLCPHCGTDPALPMHEVDRRLAQLALAPISPGRTSFIRDPQEGVALGIAILLAAVACIVLSGLTLGLFLALLLLVVIRVRLSVASYTHQGMDVRDLSTARISNLAKLAFLRLEMPYQRTVIIEAPELNAFTLGLWDTGVIVLNSELVERLSPEELLFVIGHEAAHMRCRHTTWLSLSIPTRQTRVPVVSELLGMVFNGWSLKAEYSADRGGMLAARSMMAGARALVRITTGEVLKDGADLGRYLKRAQSHDAFATVTEHMGDHPFLYNRVASLMRTAEQPAWKRLLEPYVSPTNSGIPAGEAVT
jgi:Zn-dependent protease with chaperone function